MTSLEVKIEMARRRAEAEKPPMYYRVPDFRITPPEYVRADSPTSNAHYVGNGKSEQTLPAPPGYRPGDSIVITALDGQEVRLQGVLNPCALPWEISGPERVRLVDGLGVCPDRRHN